MNKTRAIRALTSAHIFLTDEDDRSDLDCISLAASEIETALEELRTSNWTSVHVALPSYDTTVLVCNANDPDEMWWSHRSNNPQVATDSHGFCNYPPLAEITHWQKIEKLEKKSK